MENKEQLRKEIRGTVGDFVSNIKLIKIFYDGLIPGGGDVLVEVLQEELEKMKTKTTAIAMSNNVFIFKTPFRDI